MTCKDDMLNKLKDKDDDKDPKTGGFDQQPCVGDSSSRNVVAQGDSISRS